MGKREWEGGETASKELGYLLGKGKADLVFENNAASLLVLWPSFPHVTQTAV